MSSIQNNQSQTQLNAHQVDRIPQGRSISAQSAEDDQVSLQQAASEKANMAAEKALGVANTDHLGDARAKAKEIADQATQQSDQKRSNQTQRDKVTISEAARSVQQQGVQARENSQLDRATTSTLDVTTAAKDRAVESTTQHTSSAVDRARAQRSAAAHADTARDPAEAMAQRIEQRRNINEAAQPDHRMSDESFSLHI